MKSQADKNRTEHTFAVSDQVFLRLQPYIQQSVVRRKNHKLSFNFFGPYHIIERVGTVAYKLELPASSRIHPVFHVSQLKLCVSPGHQVSSKLPPPDVAFQVLVRVLQNRVRNHGVHTVAQVLVQWSGMPEDAATWEDLEAPQQQFPRAPAWGQVGLQEGGIVNDLPLPGSDPNSSTEDKAGGPRTPRPKRRKWAPSWLANGDWTQ